MPQDGCAEQTDRPTDQPRTHRRSVRTLFDGCRHGGYASKCRNPGYQVSASGVLGSSLELGERGQELDAQTPNGARVDPKCLMYAMALDDKGWLVLGLDLPLLVFYGSSKFGTSGGEAWGWDNGLAGLGWASFLPGSWSCGGV